jgi:hypothetical protein
LNQIFSKHCKKLLQSLNTKLAYHTTLYHFHKSSRVF